MCPLYRSEWAADNIRVNTVSPGFIFTPLTEARLVDPAFNERLNLRVPMQRYGHAREIADTVSFLLQFELISYYS